MFGVVYDISIVDLDSINVRRSYFISQYILTDYFIFCLIRVLCKSYDIDFLKRSFSIIRTYITVSIFELGPKKVGMSLNRIL